jgi:hypothetical protein
MKSPILRRIVGPLCAFLALSFLSGCTIAKQVRAVPPGTQITKIYVEDNPSLHMEGLVPEVVAQIKKLGIDAESYTGIKPATAKHHMTITANWRWDMAMYLFYFEATLFEDHRLLGTAEYDARMGGANMGKFGSTADKIRPLLVQLLDPVPRPTATAMGSH